MHRKLLLDICLVRVVAVREDVRLGVRLLLPRLLPTVVRYLGEDGLLPRRSLVPRKPAELLGDDDDDDSTAVMRWHELHLEFLRREWLGERRESVRSRMPMLCPGGRIPPLPGHSNDAVHFARRLYAVLHRLMLVDLCRQRLDGLGAAILWLQ